MPGTLPDGEPVPDDGSLPAGAVQEFGDAPFGVYVHVPFCRTRCGYCDFNTYTAAELGGGASQAAYPALVAQEIGLAAGVLPKTRATVSAIFFGGGTPTLLTPDAIGGIVRKIDDAFGLDGDAEVTVEANPETVGPAELAALRANGVTRLSFGMQSAVPHVLRVLDREHQPGRPVECVRWAREAGFEHVSLDLIYGTPGESDDDWRRSLTAAVETGPDHISAYALIVEDGTRLAAKVRRGEISAPDDDAMADRYQLADELLGAAGFGWYELSNWATSDKGHCRHNMLYWTGGDWWGFGPGAHSHVGGVRWWNVKHPVRYAALLESGRSPAAGRETLDEHARFTERVMLGVRRRAGLAFGDLPLASRKVVPQLATYGLVEHAAAADDRVVLTQRGRLLADAVVRELLA
jgi:putative oxygen-independent coproporphyrinogen III oxidase